jgi:nucleolin
MKELKSDKKLAGKRAKAEDNESESEEVGSNEVNNDSSDELPEDSNAEEESGSEEGANESEDKESENSKEKAEEENPEGDSSEEEKKPVKKEKTAPEGKEQEGNPAELYVGSLPFEAKEDEIKEYFSEYGEIASIKMLQRNGKYSGRSFVVFKNVKDADKAVEANGKEFKGRALIVRKAANFPSEKESKPAAISPTRVFVVNIAFDATEEKIREFFAKCGDIKEVKMINKANGTFRGFAFVEFESEESAKKAIGLSGKELDGREIKVSQAETKRDKSSGRGGFRGGNDYRGKGGSRGRGGFRGGRGNRGGRGRRRFRDYKRGKF